MCGIAGIFNAPPGFPARRAVDAMLDAMVHRGPDGRGLLEFPGGAAGMVRLALVDLSDRGRQPIWSPDGKVAILFNGEIYDFREHRARLEAQGYPFRSTTDTEVALALYLEHGPAFVEKVRGMYALAIIDGRDSDRTTQPMLALARDPFGIKPLYLAHPSGPQGPMVFASELKALLASGLVPREIDQDGLLDYLTRGFVVSPRTILAGVELMAPATTEIHRPSAPPRRSIHFRLPRYEPRTETLDEAADRLRAVLEDSVRLHALADAPVGAFLSGGTDSSGIVALMRRHVPDLRTYTLRFPDVPGFDEAPQAQDIARRLDCRHAVIDVTGAEMRDLLPRFARDLDQPSVDGLNTWLVARGAAREVKGVLSGLGGDEWFSGYATTRRMSFLRSPLGRANAAAGAAAFRLLPLVPDGILRERTANLAARRDGLSIWLHSHRVFPSWHAHRLLGHGPSLATVLDRFHGWPGWKEETAVGLSTLLDVDLYMGCQLLRDSDAVSMAHSLELRVPLVDIEVARFSRSCHDQLKLEPRSRTAKRVLIRALADVLPPGMAQRPKRGFDVPEVTWLGRDLRRVLSETAHPAVVKARGLLDTKAWWPIWRRYQTSTAEPPRAIHERLWAVMILELWCRGVLDASTQNRMAA